MIRHHLVPPSRKKISIISGHTTSDGLALGSSSTSPQPPQQVQQQQADHPNDNHSSCQATQRQLSAVQADADAAKLTRQKKKRRKRKNIVSAKLGYVVLAQNTVIIMITIGFVSLPNRREAGGGKLISLTQKCESNVHVGMVVWCVK